MFRSVEELIHLAESQNRSIADIMLDFERQASGRSASDIRYQMEKNLAVMEAAVLKGISGVKSSTGLTGGDAVRMQSYIASGKALSGDVILEAVTSAIATNEVNAAMGTICATPTAGSAGTVPGVLFGLVEKLHPKRSEMVDFLMTAGAFGLVCANNASISGAEGGCQAEVGTASAMAAAAAVQLAGGSPRQSAHAFGIALQNTLGLVCDPVAGLVEIPCIKRNAAGASNALIAADMALAGLVSEIPPDEVISAMDEIGKSLPRAYRETAEGGLANTATARVLEAQIFGCHC